MFYSILKKYLKLLFNCFILNYFLICTYVTVTGINWLTANNALNEGQKIMQISINKYKLLYTEI